MEQHQSESFIHDGKTFDIRVYYSGNLINTVVFSDNYPASGIRHQIQLPKNVAPESVLNSDVIPDFIQMAKDDIQADRWDKISRQF